MWLVSVRGAKELDSAKLNFVDERGINSFTPLGKGDKLL